MVCYGHRVTRILVNVSVITFLFVLPSFSYSDASVNVGDVEGRAAGAGDPSAATAKANAEQFTFQAEVSRLMDIIINSLYSNRDVFLRELISNASDALDKLRFLALSDPKRLENPKASDLDVRLRANKDAGTLDIIDTGVGMTRDDLIKNLGTIAKSGTAAFLKKAAEAKDGSNLIGQFGVGFYSAYLVADRVTVTSKHDNDKQYVWESGAEQTFTIYEDTEGEELGRGTKITLHLKDDASEYLDESKLKELIKKYSQFINFPIYLETTEDVEVEVKDDESEKTAEDEDSAKEKPDDKEKTDDLESDSEKDDIEKAEEEEEADDEEKDDDIKVEDDETKDVDEKKTKTRTEKHKKWTLVNEQKPIWTRDAQDVEDEEYENFYEGIAKLPGKPLAHTHFKGEGDIEFKSILFIPDRPPVGLYSGTVDEEKDAIRLYVRRVLVTDKFEYALLPRYLGFLVGIVDSDDIPINVSREMLQKSKTLDVIKRKLIRKALEMIKNLLKADAGDENEDEDDEKDDGEKDDEEKDEENEEKEDGEKGEEQKTKKKKSKYIDFWVKFGKSMKLGVIEDRSNRARLAKLLRFRSSKTDTDDAYDWTSLDDYMERMKKDQEFIYYHSGNDLESIKESPFLEKLMKIGYEVLYLTEPIDEHMIMQLPDFEGTKFMSISKDNFKFGEKDQEIEDKKNKALKKKFKPLTKLLKERLGKEKVSNVKLSTRLSSTVCVVSTDQYGYSARMEIIMKAQAFADPDSFSYMTPKAKTMELNPNHPVVKEMLAMVERGGEEDRVTELGHLIYDTALISSGYLMQDNAAYSKRMFKWIGESVGVDPFAPIEEFDLSEEKEDKKDAGVSDDESKGGEVSGDDDTNDAGEVDDDETDADNDVGSDESDSAAKDEL